MELNAILHSLPFDHYGDLGRARALRSIFDTDRLFHCVRNCSGNARVDVSLLPQRGSWIRISDRARIGNRNWVIYAGVWIV